MARRDDRQRRHERRQRNQGRRARLLTAKPCNVLRLRRRVVLHDRGGLLLDMTFGGRFGAGVLGVPFVRATDVEIRSGARETDRPG